MHMNVLETAQAPASSIGERRSHSTEVDLSHQPVLSGSSFVECSHANSAVSTDSSLPGSHPRDLPILTTFGPELCKTWSWGENGEPVVKNYGNAREFRSAFRRIADLGDLHHMQTALLKQRHSACVRAALLPHVDQHRHERLLYDKHEHNKETDTIILRRRTMMDVPREWVAFDLDGVEAASSWHERLVDFSRDLVERTFPPEFHGVGFVAVASASAGIKPGARLRLWFLLDRPLFGREVERAMAGVPIDVATLRPVQLIYTAAPLFKGMDDPVPQRVAWAWLDRDTVPLVVPPEPVKQSMPMRRPSSPGRAGSRGTTLNRLAEVVRTAAAGSRHRKLYGCAWAAGELVRAGPVTAHEVFHELAHAARCAGLTDPPEELARIIKDGLAQSIIGAA